MAVAATSTKVGGEAGEELPVEMMRPSPPLTFGSAAAGAAAAAADAVAETAAAAAAAVAVIVASGAGAVGVAVGVVVGADMRKSVLRPVALFALAEAKRGGVSLRNGKVPHGVASGLRRHGGAVGGAQGTGCCNH